VWTAQDAVAHAPARVECRRVSLRRSGDSQTQTGVAVGRGKVSTTRIVAHLVSSVGFSLYGSKAYTTAYSFSAVCVVDVCTHTVKPYTVCCVRVLSGSDLGLSSHVGRVLGPCRPASRGPRAPAPRCARPPPPGWRPAGPRALPRVRGRSLRAWSLPPGPTPPCRRRCAPCAVSTPVFSCFLVSCMSMCYSLFFYYIRYL
jgi:hypothetical protein